MILHSTINYMWQDMSDVQTVTIALQTGLAPMVSIHCTYLSSFRISSKHCGRAHAGSHFLAKSHDLHRRRRKPLEPFFSRQGIKRLEPMLADLVRCLAGRLDALKGTHSVVRLDHAFFAFTGDVIGRVCLDEPSNYLIDPQFAPQW